MQHIKILDGEYNVLFLELLYKYPALKTLALKAPFHGVEDRPMPGDQSQAENERSRRMTEIETGIYEAWKEGDITNGDEKRISKARWVLIRGLEASK